MADRSTPKTTKTTKTDETRTWQEIQDEWNPRKWQHAGGPIPPWPLPASGERQ
jgi:hypothetical protein